MIYSIFSDEKLIPTVFFKCTKELKDAETDKKAKEYAINYVRCIIKSEPDFLIGTVVNTSLNIFDVSKSINCFYKTSKDCDKTNKKYYFDFVLYFIGDKDINEIKKIDKELVIYKTDFPVITMVFYQIRCQENIEDCLFIYGREPEFLKINLSLNKETLNGKIGEICEKCVNPPHNHIFYSELGNYKIL